MKTQNNPATVAARNVAKAMNIHVAPWLDAVAISACLIKAEKHRQLIQLRSAWEAAGRPSDAAEVVEAAFNDYMDAAAIATEESRRCMKL